MADLQTTLQPTDRMAPIAVPTPSQGRIPAASFDGMLAALSLDPAAKAAASSVIPAPATVPAPLPQTPASTPPGSNPVELPVLQPISAVPVTTPADIAGPTPGASRISPVIRRQLWASIPADPNVAASPSRAAPADGAASLATGPLASGSSAVEVNQPEPVPPAPTESLSQAATDLARRGDTAVDQPAQARNKPTTPKPSAPERALLTSPSLQTPAMLDQPSPLPATPQPIAAAQPILPPAGLLLPQQVVAASSPPATANTLQTPAPAAAKMVAPRSSALPPVDQPGETILARATATAHDDASGGKAVETSPTAPAPPIAAAPSTAHPASLPPAAPTPAAALPPPLPTPAPPPAAQIAQVIADPVRVVLAAPPQQPGSPHVMTIQLNPAELGRVDIRIERSDDGPARVDLSIERPETLFKLVHDQPALAQALDQAGIPQSGRTIQFTLSNDTPASGSGAGSFTSADANTGGGGGRSPHTHAPPSSADQESSMRLDVASQRARIGLDITA